MVFLKSKVYTVELISECNCVLKKMLVKQLFNYQKSICMEVDFEIVNNVMPPRKKRNTKRNSFNT